MDITHINHYVPVWYQKRFLPGDEKLLYYLELNPRIKNLADGRKIRMNDLNRRYPGSCFSIEDLYTTSIFGHPNDEIERYLFGAIDTTGSKALNALVDQDFSQLHVLFVKFFEYIDAQKIRTPKGLDWIKSHYSTLSHIELLLEMQRIRKMHCTMWVEAVREIVSAEDSSVKYIISDHPVTVYNYACSPDSMQCRYPNDPSVAFKASQTIYPLDFNHCLILTNLEYARDPKGIDPLSNRTNARFHGQTLARIDTMIRKRKLSDEGVNAINYIIKSRARAYIAATSKEWLYPEKFYTGSWCDIRELLQPPKDELYHYGGEIFAGGKQGNVYYQDEFGRTFKHSDILNKKHKKKIGPNDLCPCGSGKKNKKCCLGKPASLRPSFDKYSIRERNLMLINIISDYFDLNKCNSWESIRDQITDEMVERIYKVIGGLWPPDTDLMNLLPHPDPTILRALYMGLVDPRIILRNVIGFTPYVDEILILSPFLNPHCLNKDISPLTEPQSYKQETIKNILLLMQLRPFIKSGNINMIPDPCDFDYELRKQTWEMANERLKIFKLSEAEMKTFESLVKDDYTRLLFSLPDDIIKNKMRASVPNITDEVISKALDLIKKIKILDPLALSQPVQPDNKHAQYIIHHFTPNYELGLFIAQVTGSFIYTHSRHRWDEICAANNTGKTPLVYEASDFEKILSDNFTFSYQVDPTVALKIRESAKLSKIRTLLKQLWVILLTFMKEPDRQLNKRQNLRNNIIKAHLSLADYWVSFRETLLKESTGPKEQLKLTAEAILEWRIPTDGFFDRNVHRLLIKHSRRTDYLSNVPMAVFAYFHEDIYG